MRQWVVRSVVFGVVGWLGACGTAPPPQSPGLERCVWVTRFEYTTEEDIERIVRQAADERFTAILFQVRGNGTVAYESRVELWSERWNFESPGFDPLAVALREARRHGVELHAWINVLPAWRGEVAKADERQLVRARPGWFLRQGPHPVALESGYYWLDPDDPSVRSYVADLCRELLTNYSVDGLHLDHIRSPSGYAKLDSVTEVVREIRSVVDANRRKPRLSAAVFADPDVARAKVGQDWVGWAREGLVDVLFPMNYTDDDSIFGQRARRAIDLAGDVPVVVGVGAYKHPARSQTSRQCRLARDIGAAGAAVFSFSSRGRT